MRRYNSHETAKLTLTRSSFRPARQPDDSRYKSTKRGQNKKVTSSIKVNSSPRFLLARAVIVGWRQSPQESFMISVEENAEQNYRSYNKATTSVEPNQLMQSNEASKPRLNFSYALGQPEASTTHDDVTRPICSPPTG